MTHRIFVRLAMFLLAITPALASATQEDSVARLFRTQQTIAETGDASAQYFLGQMHEQGLGTEQSLSEAFRWYEKAARQGNRMAQQKLARRQAMEQQRQDKIAEALEAKERARETRRAIYRQIVMQLGGDQ